MAKNEIRVTKGHARAFQQAAQDDNAALQDGQISGSEYWARVHARDAQVRAMGPEDRARVNTPVQD